jgi:hypothetical protein
MYKVEFYKYGSNIHGFYIQTKEVDYVRKMTKAELFKVADLDSYNRTKKEYFEAMSTDIDGNVKESFTLGSRYKHHLIITPISRKTAVENTDNGKFIKQYGLLLS